MISALIANPSNQVECARGGGSSSRVIDDGGRGGTFQEAGMRWGLMTSSHFGDQAITACAGTLGFATRWCQQPVGCLFGESPSRQQDYVLLSNKLSIGACKRWRASRGKNARGCSAIPVTFL